MLQLGLGEGRKGVGIRDGAPPAPNPGFSGYATAYEQVLCQKKNIQQIPSCSVEDELDTTSS
jgi:hypothetical protein